MILSYILTVRQKAIPSKNWYAVSDMGSIDQEAEDGIAHVATRCRSPS
jgi:hypothetical protein